MTMAHAHQIDSGERFEFGRNCSNFLKSLNEVRIGRAKESLKQMLSGESLQGKSFIDLGSGSGLLSLATPRLGASVHSFDYDSYSFASTPELRRRYFPKDVVRRVDQGSVLDKEYLAACGESRKCRFVS
jgi:16S rRNA G966 N2-methylase RsmD